MSKAAKAPIAMLMALFEKATTWNGANFRLEYKEKDAIHVQNSLALVSIAESLDRIATSLEVREFKP